MKILNVHFKNLNSLAGDWSIDFTHPSYADSGIFAIIGPTGAGKTTILDAICLALYGETPRLSSLSQTTNELMTRGASECSAEVEFETTRGRYRVTWQQRRARKKADGQLQAPKHELVIAATKEPIATKLSEVTKQVEQITGMDFDRFTRSMLLAQGRFAAFLQSNPNDRAPILEQITGTTLYSDISIAVFERSKQANAHLQQLEIETQGIEILAPEQQVILESELAEKESLVAAARTQLESLEAQILWLQQIHQWTEQIHQEEQNQSALALEIEAFQPNKIRLERDAIARQLDVPYSELNGFRREQKSAIQEESRIRDTLPGLEATKRNQQAHYDQFSSTLTQKRTNREAQLPIFQQVRTLDSNLNQRRELATGLRNEIDTENIRLQQLANNITDCQTRLTTVKEQQSNLDAYLAQHAHDAILIEQFSGIEADVCSCLAQCLDLNQKQTDHAADLGRLDVAKRGWAKQTEELDGTQANVREAEAAWEQGKLVLATILQGKLIRELESDRDHLLEQKRLRSIIQSLEAHRTQLSPGDACPLCGSTEHPYANGNIPSPDELDLQIRDLEAILTQARTQQDAVLQCERLARSRLSEFEVAATRVETAKSRVETLNQQVQQKSKEIQATETRLADLRSGLSARLAPFGFEDVSSETENTILDNLRQRRNRWQENQSQRQTTESHIARIEAEISREQGIAKEIQDALNAKVQDLQSKERTIQELVSERRELFGDLDPDTEWKNLQDEIDAIEKTTASANEQLRIADDAWITANANLTTLHDRVVATTDQLEELEPAFQAKLQRLGFADEDDFCLARLDDGLLQELKRTQIDLERRQLAISLSLTEKRSALQRELDRKLTEKSQSELETSKTEVKNNNEDNLRRLVELQAQLRKNQENAARVRESAQQIANQRIECERWGGLNHLIGSADGRKYRNFVQSLTFERLVHFANLQLANMTNRYLLIPDKETPLTLNVIDSYQANEVRTTKNLSGGETFIVSLALALGLSRLASQRVRVDSLFLDEGFGTLDEEALDVALDTLSSLQQEGKLIGVISHVPALKERISTKIQVSPKGAGRSVLMGPGCSRRPTA